MSSLVGIILILFSVESSAQDPPLQISPEAVAMSYFIRYGFEDTRSDDAPEDDAEEEGSEGDTLHSWQVPPVTFEMWDHGFSGALILLQGEERLLFVQGTMMDPQLNSIFYGRLEAFNGRLRTGGTIQRADVLEVDVFDHNPPSDVLIQHFHQFEFEEIDIAPYLNVVFLAGNHAMFSIYDYEAVPDSQVPHFSMSVDMGFELFQTEAPHPLRFRCMGGIEVGMIHRETRPSQVLPNGLARGDVYPLFNCTAEQQF